MPKRATAERAAVWCGCSEGMGQDKGNGLASKLSCGDVVGAVPQFASFSATPSRKSVTF